MTRPRRKTATRDRSLGAPFLRRIITLPEQDGSRPAYPGAVLFSLDGDAIRQTTYRETEHYRVTRDFLNAPERYFRHLFPPDDEGEDDP